MLVGVKVLTEVAGGQLSGVGSNPDSAQAFTSEPDKPGLPLDLL